MAEACVQAYDTVSQQWASQYPDAPISLGATRVSAVAWEDAIIYAGGVTLANAGSTGTIIQCYTMRNATWPWQ